MIVELTNPQRENLGLQTVHPSWDKVSLDDQTVVYFDGNTIKKKITVSKEAYEEIELDEATENRTNLLPKTGKGKSKKVSVSSLASRKGIGMYFQANLRGVTLGNFTTEKTFYSTDFEAIRFQNGQELAQWVEQFTTSLTPEELEAIKKFAAEKKRRVNLKEGDFFVFKVDRFQYGFGRLLCDLRKLRKETRFSLKKNYGLAQLMTQPLVVKVYHYIDQTKKQDLHYLKSLQSLPAQYIMDNQLYFGDFEVLGNLPLEDWELDFPISYARSIQYGDFDTVYLQYGEIYKETHRSTWYKHIEIPNPNSKYDWDKCLKFNPYRNESVDFNLSLDKTTLEQVIAKKSNQPYWDNPELEYDLRNPLNQAIKEELFHFFGLDAQQSYAENKKKVG